MNPDFATQDLFQSIQNKTFPGWTLFAQILTPEQAETFKCVPDLPLNCSFLISPDVAIGTMCWTSPSASAKHSVGFALLTPLYRDWGFDDVPRTEIGKFFLTENPTK